MLAAAPPLDDHRDVRGAESVADENSNDLDDIAGRLWHPAFPSPELVQHAADLLPHIADEPAGPGSELKEGPVRTERSS